jgi:hypothetical protein
VVTAHGNHVVETHLFLPNARQVDIKAAILSALPAAGEAGTGGEVLGYSGRQPTAEGKMVAISV